MSKKKLVFRISELYGFSYHMWAFKGLLDILGSSYIHQNQKLQSNIKGISFISTQFWSIKRLFSTVSVISIQIPKDQFYLGHPVGNIPVLLSLNSSMIVIFKYDILEFQVAHAPWILGPAGSFWLLTHLVSNTLSEKYNLK